MTVDVAYAVRGEMTSRFEAFEKIGRLCGVIAADDDNLTLAKDGAALRCKGSEGYAGVIV